MDKALVAYIFSKVIKKNNNVAYTRVVPVNCGLLI